MGKIYFASDLREQTLKALMEAHDCADVKNDLDRIQWTIQYGTNEQAGYLDREMRQKTIAKLMRYGYGYEEISDCLSSHFSEEDDAF